MLAVGSCNIILLSSQHFTDIH